MLKNKNEDDQALNFLRDDSYEEIFQHGYALNGPELIRLSQSVLLDDCEWLDFKEINGYESRKTKNGHTFVLLEVEASGKFKSENTPFFHLACFLQTWGCDGKLISGKIFGDFWCDQKLARNLLSKSTKITVEKDLENKSKNAYLSIFKSNLSSEGN